LGTKYATIINLDGSIAASTQAHGNAASIIPEINGNGLWIAGNNGTNLISAKHYTNTLGEASLQLSLTGGYAVLGQALCLAVADSNGSLIRYYGDYGNLLREEAVALGAYGGAPPQVSQFSGALAPINNGQGIVGAISTSNPGMFLEGVTLTAGGITGDPDGDGTITAYQWYLNDAEIPGANSSSYTTSATGFGNYKVAVTYDDGQGFSATIDSAVQAISKIDNGRGRLAAITGQGGAALLEGVTLTAGAITGDPDGDGHTDAYQWYKNGVAIAGAVSASLNTTATGVGAYSVAVSYTDGQGYSETLLSSSVDVAFNSSINHAPTDLLTSATSFNENIAAGTTVATLSSTDPDTADTFTYTLVGGTDSIDNTAFSINNNQLRINASPNFEAKSSYSIRLRATDNAGLHFEKPVTLTVNDLTETVTSLVTTFLAYDKDILQLTGSRHVFGTGNAKDNTIIGNSGRNGLTGGLGKDTLTGGGGVDTFIYSARNESLLSGFDVITDYASGELISCYFETRGNRITSSRGTLDALNESSIQQLLDPTFQAHTVDAFQVKGYNGCFVAINDNRDGFQAATDSIIHLSNYALGSDNPIAIF